MSYDGLAGLPGFGASLRLLVEDERYSLTDVAMMFNVTRERIRQLCVRLGIETPRQGHVGLFCTRVWDDSKHRFQPVLNGEIALRRRAAERASKREALDARREQRRASVVEAVLALRDRLQRDPSWREMYECVRPGIAVGANVPHTALLLNWWDTRHRPMREKMRDFRKATGTNRRAAALWVSKGPRKPRNIASPSSDGQEKT